MGFFFGEKWVARKILRVEGNVERMKEDIIASTELENSPPKDSSAFTQGWHLGAQQRVN